MALKAASCTFTGVLGHPIRLRITPKTASSLTLRQDLRPCGKLAYAIFSCPKCKKPSSCGVTVGLRFIFAHQYLERIAGLAVKYCSRLVHLPCFVPFTILPHLTECSHCVQSFYA